MNYKIYSILSFLLVFSYQITFAQTSTADENGRSPEALAKQKQVPETADNLVANSRNSDNENIAELADKDEGVYERYETSSAITTEVQANQQLQELAAQFEALKLSKDELEAEITDIKKSLQMCCGSNSLEAADNASYLMQNTPNPFYETTKIQYYIPELAGYAELQVRDLSGKILKTYKLDQRGIAEVDVERKAFESGSYVYTLEVDGQLVDSKIMILTR